MTFDNVMGTVMQWATATEALAALGAELAVQDPGVSAPPEIVAALRAVSAAAGLEGIDELVPQQRSIAIGIIRTYLHTALDLLEHPERPAGWTFTDPAILDGWGTGSAMVPPMIASAHPDLADVTSFLDVGTGVGFLAVAAASVWPKATVVGIDPWESSLERARANVAAAGLDDRITLRREELAAIADVEAFDCAWIPSFFLTEADLEKGLSAVARALRPGGWVVVGRMRPPPVALAEATSALRTIRSGGCALDAAQATKLIEQAGFTAVHIAALPGPSPMELVLGQRPAR